ncbi:alkaline serine protease Alp1 [Colletotrichum higginsianum]|uniref:Alkaline serine protease Alp1 n=1 Tax=Colletotrichum higginsianum (strain IMI 349063) TaxID=759273 RepID=H1VD78_COLHI|nr:Alkaline serine protease Alp1 [Colletotrichum higginsianum IMI 349063]OBR03943.1 Alkaline serine protease Alp1 [Colletotrichum higginsianum IMI 349063]CCF38181.1 alkaline serine protease Alp1 [Colletotrichum higginsianum]
MKASSLLALLGAVVPALAANKYIIQLKPGTSPDAVTRHHNAVRSLLRRRDGSAEGTLDKTFRIGDDFNAYSGSFDDAALEAIAALDEVLAVELDQPILVDPTEAEQTLFSLSSESESSAASSSSSSFARRRALTTQPNSIWSLGDLSHRAAGSTEYVYDSTAGEGTTAYVFDTGIRLSHAEFEGRASFGINGVTGSTVSPGSNSDTDGHGTHVAATIVGKTYGVAKKAKVIDVKVFDGSTGSTSAILTGLDWAVKDIVSKGAQKKSVLNMSLSANNVAALDNAVLAAYRQGILTIVAAGNDNQPATTTSPARLPEAFTVGMTRPDRGRVNIIEGIYGSSYGPELDVFAPGQDIVSASHTSDTGTATKTGTSMAAPLVAGLVCYLRGLAGGFGTPKQVTDRILELAIPGVVGDPKNSPNLLVNNGSGR